MDSSHSSSSFFKTLSLPKIILFKIEGNSPVEKFSIFKMDENHLFFSREGHSALGHNEERHNKINRGAKLDLVEPKR